MEDHLRSIDVVLRQIHFKCSWWYVINTFNMKSFIFCSHSKAKKAFQKFLSFF